MGIIGDYHHELNWFKDHGYIGPFPSISVLKRYICVKILKLKFIFFKRPTHGEFGDYFGEGFYITPDARLDYENVKLHDPDLKFSVITYSNRYVLVCYSFEGFHSTHFIISHWIKD